MRCHEPLAILNAQRSVDFDKPALMSIGLRPTISEPTGGPDGPGKSVISS